MKNNSTKPSISSGVSKDGSKEEPASETCIYRILRCTGVVHKGMTVPNWKYIRIMFVALFSSAFSLCFLFPFLPDLVLSMGYSEEDKGYYCGLIASSLFAGRAVGSYFWGWLSDIKGRRLVLLVTIALNGIFSFCFGFSVNLPLAMIFRFLSGLSNGTVGTVKSVLYEISDNTNQAIGMSTITLSWGLGLILGPTFGGLIASPAQKYPHLFDEHGFFADYAFLLPSALTAFVCLLSFIYVFLTFEETLNKTDLEFSVAVSELSLAVSGTRRPTLDSKRKRCDSNVSSAFSLSMETLHFPPAAELFSSQLDRYLHPEHDEVRTVHCKDNPLDETVANDCSTNDERMKLLGCLHRDVMVVMESDENMSSLDVTTKHNIAFKKKENFLSSVDTSTHPKVTLNDQNNYLGNDCMKIDKLKNVDETRSSVTESTVAKVTLNEDHECDVVDDHTKMDTLKDMDEIPSSVTEINVAGITLNEKNNHCTTHKHSKSNNCKDMNESYVPDENNHGNVEHQLNSDNYKDAYGTLSSANENNIPGVLFVKENSRSVPAYDHTESDEFHARGDQLIELNTSESQDIAKGDKSETSWIQRIRRTKLITLLSNSDVRSSVMMYTIFSFGVIAFDDVFTVWLSTKPRLDGIGFNSGEIGMSMGVVAAPLMIVQLLFFPTVVNKFGIKWTYVIGAFFIMVPIQILPLLHLVYDDKVLVWALLIVLLIPEKAACNFCFACTSLLINNSVLPENAGAVNGIAMTLTALARTLAPTVGGSVYAWSITHGDNLGIPFDVSFSFVLIGLTFVCSILQGIFLPSHLNRQKK